MKFIDLFMLSTRMFKARTSRTFLTILGMSVGIGAILFLVSMGYGLQKTLLEKITTSDSLLTLDVAEDKTSTAVLDEAAVEKVKEIPGVGEVSPAVQIRAQGRLNELTTDLSVTIVNPTYLKLGGIKMNEGRLLDNEKKEGILVSSSVAQIFGKTMEEIIGKKISFVFFVPKTGTENSDLDSTESSEDSYDKIESNVEFEVIGAVEADDSIVYINSAALSSLNVSRYSQLKVKCGSNREMEGVQAAITEQGYMVSSLSDTVDQANKVFDVVKIVLMLFGIIALIVSAIGMFNTMTITLLERTEEIGIMKSIGASDSMISLMFIMEATIMGFLGGLVGIIIGWLEGQMFNGVVNLVAGHFGGEKVDLFYSPLWFVMAVIIFSAFVGFITGVIPARRASHIDPLDALRYK
ncbi:MAG: hypothetical protein QG620_799 [Patescibacteria group bacterium]|nr:hypothetical protein [Patescibacteria group bacterium]